jgi:ribosomal protein S18 acetylase RimI-like enzyme
MVQNREKVIRFAAASPPADQFWTLFQTTGWNEEYRLSRNELLKAVSQSWYCVGAYDLDKLVGFGRIVSDGILHAMIYDLIVLPSHQGCGIGTRILDMLIMKCREKEIRDIQLFCAQGKQRFYEKRGFISRPENAPGMDYRHGGK